MFSSISLELPLLLLLCIIYNIVLQIMHRRNCRKNVSLAIFILAIMFIFGKRRDENESSDSEKTFDEEVTKSEEEKLKQLLKHVGTLEGYDASVSASLPGFNIVH